MDGTGVKNENVTRFRYALVESDTLPIAEQDVLFRRLELPVAALVHSGGKSLHAIVHIDAADYEEYRKRVDFLYDFLVPSISPPLAVKLTSFKASTPSLFFTLRCSTMS